MPPLKVAGPTADNGSNASRSGLSMICVCMNLCFLQGREGSQLRSSTMQGGLSSTPHQTLAGEATETPGD